MDEVTGEVITGLRQYGISKEHRPNPIVEMGLFMDSRGIPITMCLHPGNKSEQLTAVPLEKEVLKMIPDAKFIYCADAGLGSYNIRKFNSMGGRSFIVTQSVKKLSSTLKEAVFNDYGYKLLSDDTPVTLKDMKTFDSTCRFLTVRWYSIIFLENVMMMRCFRTPFDFRCTVRPFFRTTSS